MDSDNSKAPSYVQPGEGGSRPRVSYEGARKEVQNRQHYQKVDGYPIFKSAIEDSWNKLNNDGTDPTYQNHYGDTRQPVLDHIIQYAALDEVYVSLLSR